MKNDDKGVPSLLDLPRKRVDSSPLINASKIQQQQYHCDDREEVPFINLSLGTLTQSVNDVKQRIEKELIELAGVMKISSDKIETMLCQSSWNKDLVLQVSNLV